MKSITDGVDIIIIDHSNVKYEQYNGRGEEQVENVRNLQKNHVKLLLVLMKLAAADAMRRSDESW